MTIGPVPERTDRRQGGLANVRGSSMGLSMSQSATNGASRASLTRVAKRAIKAPLRAAGYDVYRIKPAAPPPDPAQLGLYRELYDAETLARKPFYNVGAGA